MNAACYHLAAATGRPLWPIVFGMTLLLFFGLPFVLRNLWPSMRRRTAWLISLAVVFVYLFVMTPARVAISNILRGGQSM